MKGVLRHGSKQLCWYFLTHYSRTLFSATCATYSGGKRRHSESFCKIASSFWSCVDVAPVFAIALDVDCPWAAPRVWRTALCTLKATIWPKVCQIWTRETFFPPDSLSCIWSLFCWLSQHGTPTDCIEASGGREIGASETAGCHYIIYSLPWNIKIIMKWMLLERWRKQQAKKIFLDLTGSALTYLHLKHLSMCKEFSCIWMHRTKSSVQYSTTAISIFWYN